MAINFIKKVWLDRQSEHPNRRTLVDVATNETKTVDVTRAEGTVEQEGDLFDATTFNVFEQRIADAFTQAQSEIDKLYYKSGDTITKTIHTAGYTTSGAAQIRFVVPLIKPVASGVSVEVGGNYILRQAGQYTHGSGAGVSVTPTAVTVDKNDFGLVVYATFESTTNAINNDVVGIVGNLNIRFV